MQNCSNFNSQKPHKNRSDFTINNSKHNYFPTSESTQYRIYTKENAARFRSPFEFIVIGRDYNSHGTYIRASSPERGFDRNST